MRIAHCWDHGFDLRIRNRVSPRRTGTLCDRQLMSATGAGNSPSDRPDAHRLRIDLPGRRVHRFRRYLDDRPAGRHEQTAGAPRHRRLHPVLRRANQVRHQDSVITRGDAAAALWALGALGSAIRHGNFRSVR